MTRKEEITIAAFKCFEEEESSAVTAILVVGFARGAEWADAHPHWISVEDEMPKIGWTMSDTVVVTDGNGGLRLAWYHQDEGWHFATGLPFEPTHWMPLPQAPHHIADVSKKVEKGGEE